MNNSIEQRKKVAYKNSKEHQKMQKDKKAMQQYKMLIEITKNETHERFLYVWVPPLNTSHLLLTKLS